MRLRCRRGAQEQPAQQQRLSCRQSRLKPGSPAQGTRSAARSPAPLPGPRKDAPAAELRQPAAPLGSAASSNAAPAQQTGSGAVCTSSTFKSPSVFHLLRERIGRYAKPPTLRACIASYTSASATGLAHVCSAGTAAVRRGRQEARPPAAGAGRRPDGGDACARPRPARARAAAGCAAGHGRARRAGRRRAAHGAAGPAARQLPGGAQPPAPGAWVMYLWRLPAVTRLTRLPARTLPAPGPGQRAPHCSPCAVMP